MSAQTDIDHYEDTRGAMKKPIGFQKGDEFYGRLFSVAIGDKSNIRIELS